MVSDKSYQHRQFKITSPHQRPNGNFKMHILGSSFSSSIRRYEWCIPRKHCTKSICYCQTSPYAVTVRYLCDHAVFPLSLYWGVGGGRSEQWRMRLGVPLSPPTVPEKPVTLGKSLDHGLLSKWHESGVKRGTFIRLSRLRGVMVSSPGGVLSTSVFFFKCGLW